MARAAGTPEREWWWLQGEQRMPVAQLQWKMYTPEQQPLLSAGYEALTASGRNEGLIFDMSPVPYQVWKSEPVVVANTTVPDRLGDRLIVGKSAAMWDLPPSQWPPSPLLDRGCGAIVEGFCQIHREDAELAEQLGPFLADSSSPAWPYPDKPFPRFPRCRVALLIERMDGHHVPLPPRRETAEELAQKRKATSMFRFYNSGGNGRLACDEMGQMLRVADPNWPEDAIRNTFSMVDTNSDGHIDLQEFLRWALTPESAGSVILAIYEPPSGECRICAGPCRCSECHGLPEQQGRCSRCSRRGPCWGGDTWVLLPGGDVKKLRECSVGDEVRTLTGSRRIAQIWELDPEKHTVSDVEVCCIDGVWITAYHPVISNGDWFYPAELQVSSLWREKQHLMPDMYNLELEGHDDTILLYGGGGLVVSCTIGKYLGPRFGYGACTRRSTRCGHLCAQCDAVFVEGLRFDALPEEVRWGRFQAFPQVEWDNYAEFELAALASQSFVPPAIPEPANSPTAVVQRTETRQSPVRCAREERGVIDMSAYYNSPLLVK